MEDQPGPTLVGGQALEPFLLLAKSAKGSAVAELIKHVTEANGVYVFGELLECECVAEARGGAQASSVRLLEIFAYSTYEDYKREAATLPPLSLIQVTKLKHLTIVSLASECRTIPYSTLLTKLDIQSLRELEDLIIEAIYAGVIQAKLDQKNERLEVESFIGRDIKTEELAVMVDKLDSWCSNCMQILQSVEGEMSRANTMKLEHNKTHELREKEVKQLRETLKVASTLESEAARPPQQGRELPKTTVKKGLRGSAAPVSGQRYTGHIQITTHTE